LKSFWTMWKTAIAPLEKFLEFFEQDVLLIRKAQTQLAEAEQKVQLLIERGARV